MSEASIFSEVDPPKENEGVQNPPTKPTVPQELAELVGEGKKYKSVDDALKSIPHAQSHIQKLEEELAANREALAKAKGMDEFLQEFKQQNTREPETVPQVQTKPNEPVDIEKAVEVALARKEAARIKQANADSVIGAFKTAYGEEGEAKFIKLAQENGVSLQELNNLATTAPEVVLKLAGLKKNPVGHVPHSTSSVTTSTTSTPNELSSRIPSVGSTTKDLVAAVQNARKKVLGSYN